MAKIVTLAGLGMLSLCGGALADQRTSLPTWTFKWTYNGTPYSAVFVGTNPTAGGTSTIPTSITPVALKFGTTEESPLAKDRKGRSALSTTLASPLFQTGIDFVLGGTDLGRTQYTDAFQRGALWGAGVQANPSYHVLLGGPKVKKLLILNVPRDDGGVSEEFGVKVILADINWFDSQIHKHLAHTPGAPSDGLSVFLMTQSYLTTGGSCCIGGYHSLAGDKSYLAATFIQKSGAFAEDVSALSGELGEWLDDPLIGNASPCTGGYSVIAGGNGKPPYGAYPYRLNGFTYHLENLLFPPYFGAPPTTSVNGWFDFHNVLTRVCEQP